MCRHLLGYPESDDSDESKKEESDELGSESGSFGTFSTRLGGLLCGLRLPVGRTLPVYYLSCDCWAAVEIGRTKYRRSSERTVSSPLEIHRVHSSFVYG